ncbi:MAG: nucleotide exchange factor GrpE, partial [Clostridia bacterium]|nr:nucleotide exchange factor GrpE [Clostridia bacterium]
MSTEKEKNQKPQEAEETEQTAAQEAEPVQEEKESELDTLKKSYDELYDKHLRTLAEYENYKRRTQKEKTEIYARAQAETLTDLLPVLDNLERAAA